MKFENTDVWGFEGAFRGMRNPLDSWKKADSSYGYSDEYHKNMFIIGSNDMDLAQRLIAGGSEHRKFLRQIVVSVDITAPRYWWSEFDTYKIGTVANSCSTMHKLKSYPFTFDMFELDEPINTAYWQIVIDHLEDLRIKYNSTNDMKWFREMKQALPECFKQKRTVTLNYENIRTMCRQRKDHRLKEWSTDFITWAKSLPYAKELIF